MKDLFLFTLSCVLITIASGFEIRLWPVNARGNEGFVEAYHDGLWGLIGSPQFRFSDETASFLCRTLGLSEFGYSSGWTSIDNYGGYVWTYGLECTGNETDIEQCHRPSKWERYNYSNKTDWAYRHGTRLYCTDSRIKVGATQNTGTIESYFDGKRYTLCYDGVDMSAANVLCNHLGYDGALSIEKGEPDDGTQFFNKKLSCKGCEYSLTECDRSANLTSTCYFAAVVTCKAVRLARMNRYQDEGAVEVYHDGSWGFVGDPGYSLDDQTASYLCKRFGISDVGFSVTAHPLDTYGRKGWMQRLSCTGNETNVMQCQHTDFYTVPTLMHTYRRGTWLYCFSYNITDIRLTGGATANEGRVELLINGRWGSISTHAARYYDIQNVGKVICAQLGFSGFEHSFATDNVGRNDDLFWMSQVVCLGYEDNISKCHFEKGTMSYDHQVYLKIRCTDNSNSGSGSPIVG